MPEAPQFDFAGHRFALHPKGEGPKVVMLHSSGLSSAQWARLQAQLGGRYRSFAVDLLGYGESAPWPEGVRFEPRIDIEAIAALVGELGPVHLVGHSYGGFVALQVSRLAPERVRSLAVFEPVAFGVLDPAQDPAAIAALERLDGALGQTGYRAEAEGTRAQKVAWLRAFVDFWMGEGWFDRLKPSVRDAYVSVAHVMQGQVETVSRDRTPLEAYRGVRAPALLLSGEKSPLPARRVCARFASGLPRSQHHGLEGAGHMGPVINAGEVNALIAAHLDQVEGSRG